MYMKTISFYLLVLCFCSLLTGCSEPVEPAARIESLRQQMQILDRGRYVIVVMGCNDCHTPDYMVRRGEIADEDWLVGSTLGFKGPNGTSYPTNLRLLASRISEESWLDIAKKMRKETPMADVMLPDVAEADLRAIYRYIQYLGPKGDDAPAALPAGVTPETQYILSPAPH